MLTRRSTLAAFATFGLASRAAAQGFPSHPITIVVPYPPGGPIDLLARVIAREADLGEYHSLFRRYLGGATAD